MDPRSAVLSTLVAVFEVRAVILQHFIVTDNAADRLALGDVGRGVAAAQGLEYSSRLQRRVNHALKLLGLTRRNRTGGIPRVVGLKKK